MVLVSVLFALAAKDAKMVFVYLCYFPAFAFWGFDGFLYRQLYDKVRSQPEDSVDFSWDTPSVYGVTSVVSKN